MLQSGSLKNDRITLTAHPAEFNFYAAAIRQIRINSVGSLYID